MRKAPELREIFGPPDEVVDAAADGSVVLFVGSGLSMLCGLPSWKELAERVLHDLRWMSLLNYSEIEQLQKLDPRKQLSIAMLIAKENDREIEFLKHLKRVDHNDDSRIYELINDIGCACVTTNYDELLLPRLQAAEDGSSMPISGSRTIHVRGLYSYLLDEPGNVIHLHGIARKPETMILTMEDYMRHYNKKHIQEFLTSLFARKKVVFVGYGLEESEILEFIFRRSGIRPKDTKDRFALQGFFQSESPLYEKLYKYYEHTFGVHLLGFLKDYQGYKTQETIIQNWVDKLTVRPPTLVEDMNLLKEVFPDG